MSFSTLAGIPSCFEVKQPVLVKTHCKGFQTFEDNGELFKYVGRYMYSRVGSMAT